MLGKTHSIIFLLNIVFINGFTAMSSVGAHVDKLVGAMTKIRNVDKAQSMSKYLKGRFACLGVHKPQRDVIQKKWFLDLKKDDDLNHWEIASALWALDEREYQYVAIDFLRQQPKRIYEKEDHKRIEELISTKSWWDTVDHIASNVAGAYLQKYPDMIDPVITRWRNSDDMWLHRTCLLFQLRYKENTDFQLLQDLVLQYLHVDEFFIQKAIGWSLRHYSRTDPDAVRHFIRDLDMSTVAKREAIKYI